ncbi:g9613 [Coccomyxa viridis]|uniref:G9613 protein n=1 Tax=Coccomyxa viridis TaxID=1274662 RepID=A0ABP1G3G6_9CHLO
MPDYEATEEDVLKGQIIQSSGQKAQDLLILRQGHAQQQGQLSEQGPGSVLGLQDLLLERGLEHDIVAASDCIVWRVPSKALKGLLRSSPDLGLHLFRLAFGQLEARTEVLQGEAARWQELRPYLVSSPKRGVIGSSRYAKRLRSQILAASKAENRKPVYIFGEPGLEKDELATLIHFGSARRRQPMAQIDCAQLNVGRADELLGNTSKQGLLAQLDGGTLLLNNVHQVPAYATERILQLLGASQNPSGDAADLRVIMTSEQHCADFEKLADVIKVPPLRVRPADIADMAVYFSRQLSKRSAVRQMGLTSGAVRQLESYDFPNNIQELEGIVSRAMRQAAQSLDTAQVPEDVFWYAQQAQDRFRVNLFKVFSPLQQFARSSLWPDDINFRLTAYIYPAYVLLLLLGPQERSTNFGLNLFWCYWWPLSFIVYPFLGRIWCSVCPFMIYGELVQRWRLAQGAVLRKWPHKSVASWGPWFLWALFAAILVWEEVWDLPNTAYLSAWLLLIITAGAMACSWFFERRLWCRHLCPIGGMNGMFAKLSMTELRAHTGICSGNCSTYHCYKGGPEEPPAGLETAGCPVYSHPAQLVDNRNCVLCMTCDKACPHDSVELRLRPPGIDLWTSHKPMAAELALQFTLLGAVYLHHLPQLLQQVGLQADVATPTLQHCAASALVLLLPGILALGVDFASPLADLGMVASGLVSEKQGARAAKPFIEVAYGYLPLVWGITLAHYLLPLLDEAGRVLPVTAVTVGLGAWSNSLPVFVEDGSVIAFLQGSVLIASTALSLALTRKLTSRPWLRILPQCIMTAAFAAEAWLVILGPQV